MCRCRRVRRSPGPTDRRHAVAFEACPLPLLPLAFVAKLVAKDDTAAELGDLLTAALELANEEAGTVVWFALRTDPTTFWIVDAFPSEDARQAHLGGASPPRSWPTPTACWPARRRSCPPTSSPPRCRDLTAPPRRRLAPLEQSVLARHGAALRRRSPCGASSAPTPTPLLLPLPAPPGGGAQSARLRPPAPRAPLARARHRFRAVADRLPTRAPSHKPVHGAAWPAGRRERHVAARGSRAGGSMRFGASFFMQNYADWGRYAARGLRAAGPERRLGGLRRRRAPRQPGRAAGLRFDLDGRAPLHAVHDGAELAAVPHASWPAGPSGSTSAPWSSCCPGTTPSGWPRRWRCSTCWPAAAGSRSASAAAPGAVEFEGFRTPMGESRDRFLESLEIVRAAPVEPGVLLRRASSTTSRPCRSGRSPASGKELARPHVLRVGQPGDHPHRRQRRARAAVRPPEGLGGDRPRRSSAFNGVRAERGWEPQQPIVVCWVYCRRTRTRRGRRPARTWRNYNDSALRHYEFHDADHFNEAGGYDFYAKMARGP